MSAAIAADRQVAVTFDDLPGTSLPLVDRCSEQRFVRETANLTSVIAKHGVPVTAFVNAGRLCDGLDPGSLVALLTLWVEAGAELGNHTFSHPSLDSVTLEQYIADIKLGEPAVESAQGKSPRYFRHPFLRRGATNAKKEGLEAFLKEAGYIEAPVTLDNSEWMFARAYARAKEAQDEEARREIATIYVDYMEQTAKFFERRSLAVLGYEPPQILLVHASSLNFDHFSKIIEMFRRRGYQFVSLDDALRHKAYRSRDEYVGKMGISWLHRWGLAKGLPIEWEPEPPALVQ